MTSTTTTKRYVTPLLVWALLFAAVGFGNVWIGYTKRLYYTEAVASASRAHNRGEVSPSQHSIHQRRLLSRVDYYALVYNGGIVFLAIAAFLFSAAIIRPFRYRCASRLDEGTE